MAEKKIEIWQLVLLFTLCGAVEGSLTGRYLENGSVVIGCSHERDGHCYVATLANLSDEVTDHKLIEHLGHPVWSNTNSMYIEIIFTPMDDEWDKYLVEVFENKTKKEGSYISLEVLKKRLLVTTIKPTPPYTSTTPTPDTTTGQILPPNTPTGPDSSTGPTPHSTVDNTVPILASIAATLSLVFLTTIAVVIGIVLAIRRYKGKRCSCRKERTGDVPSDTV